MQAVHTCAAAWSVTLRRRRRHQALKIRTQPAKDEARLQGFVGAAAAAAATSHTNTLYQGLNESCFPMDQSYESHDEVVPRHLCDLPQRPHATVKSLHLCQQSGIACQWRTPFMTGHKGPSHVCPSKKSRKPNVENNTTGTGTDWLWLPAWSRSPCCNTKSDTSKNEVYIIDDRAAIWLRA